MSNNSLGCFGCLTILLVCTAVDAGLAWIITFVCNHLLPSIRMNFSKGAFISSALLFVVLFIYSVTRKEVDDHDLV